MISKVDIAALAFLLSICTAVILVAFALVYSL